jgi:RNA polymerase sigma-70 factor (ECF subfamily)
MPPSLSTGQSLPLRSLAGGDDERVMVLAARRGDEKAFRDLYEAYREPVWRLINSLVGDPVQAQDIFQNVILKAFRGLVGFRFQSCLLTWIYRIARNECFNHLRKRDTELLSLGSIAGDREETVGIRASHAQQERQAALRSAVLRLPFRMREVIVLRYMQDLSYKEIGRVLGCPTGTVASRLARALAELESRLRTSGQGPENPAGSGSD